jgi:glycerophosphoryl diester phosphodiesterase
MMRKIIFFAHRGGGEGVFENRLETIKSTLEKDYIDAIEIDVRVTKDEILVIHHDRGVYVNGRKIWIDELDYQKIKHLGIPTLEEVVSLFAESKKALNIDIKDERCLMQLKRFFRRREVKFPIYFDCFDLDLLLELQSELTIGEYSLSLTPRDSHDFSTRFVVRILLLLVSIVFSQFIVYFLRRKVRKIKIDGISIHHKFATSGFIRDLKAFGFKVFVWGVENEKEFSTFLTNDIDGIKTDKISLLQRIR